MMLDLEHGEAQWQMYLRRRQPHADVLAHRIDHVVEVAPVRVLGRVDVLRRDWLGAGAQHRKTKMEPLDTIIACSLEPSRRPVRSSPVAAASTTTEAAVRWALEAELHHTGAAGATGLSYRQHVERLELRPDAASDGVRVRDSNIDRRSI